MRSTREKTDALREKPGLRGMLRLGVKGRVPSCNSYEVFSVSLDLVLAIPCVVLSRNDPEVESISRLVLKLH